MKKQKILDELQVQINEKNTFTKDERNKDKEFAKFCL